MHVQGLNERPKPLFVTIQLTYNVHWKKGSVQAWEFTVFQLFPALSWDQFYAHLFIFSPILSGFDGFHTIFQLFWSFPAFLQFPFSCLSVVQRGLTVHCILKWCDMTPVNCFLLLQNNIHDYEMWQLLKCVSLFEYSVLLSY